MRPFRLLCVLLALGAVDVAQADSVASTRNHYATINRELKGYRKVDRDLSGFSTEGGTLSLYYKGTQLRKIVARYFGESGRRTDEFYFWNGSLFFYLKADLGYDELFGKVTSREETRLYFENKKVTRYLKGQESLSTTSKEAQALRDEVLKDAYMYFAMARAPKSR